MKIVELFEALRRGQSGSEQLLARALGRDLRCYFAARCKETDAEDLVQSTLEVIWRKLPEFEPQHPDSFRRWVLAIAAREAKSACNRRRRELELGGDLPGTPAALDRRQSSELLWRERAELVRAELEELDDRHRRALEHELAEGDLRAFAAQEGISPETVRTRRFKARTCVRCGIDSRRRTPPHARS